MAEAAEQSEPTMEEILASIRKIIATETIPDPKPPPAEDILELTDVVEEEPEPTQPKPQPEPEPVVEPVLEPEVVATEPEPPKPEPSKPEPKPEPIAEAPVDEPLVAPETTALAATSFAQLAEELEKQRVSLAPHISVGNGQQTLENLVVEIMRPLLKEWLDQNLAVTVERLVQAEIERINRRHST